MALTFQEASQIAVQKAQETGIPLTGQETAEDIFKLAGQLPDTAPDVGGVGSDIQTLSDLGFLPDQGQFASSVDLLQQQKTDRIGSAVTGAQREFDDPLREARENIEKVRGGATAQATRHAGGLGLDTATQGFIQSQVDIAQKAVTELEKKRDEAMRNAKLDTAAEYDDLILAENKRISDLRQQTFENLLKVGTARRAEEAGERADQATVLAAQKFGLDIVKFEDGQARFERTQGLTELKEFRIASEEQRERLLDDITRMAESGIALEQLSDEQINQFEIAAELPSGTFEAFYQRISDDVARGELLDELKIYKAKADIANVYSTIQKREEDAGLKDRFLTIAEADRFNVPMGTLLSEVFGEIIPPKEEAGLTPSQIATANRQLLDDVTNVDSSFGLELDKDTASLDVLADIAVASGVSFEGFKAALQASNEIRLDNNKVIHLQGKNEDIGDINTIRDKFNQQGIISPTTGTQEDLDEIIFGGEEGEF